MKIDAVVLRELQMELVTPFETSFGMTTHRRVMLVEVRAEGLVGWGECVAGEHPWYSEESIDTAWQVGRHELARLLLDADPEHGGQCHEIFRQIRGNRMCKAAFENALWDVQAQAEGVSLASLLGGTRATIPCGVSLGITPTLEQLLERVETALAAGYQRIKVKCRPGWDTDVFAAIRMRWPRIQLTADANASYRLKDMDLLASFDHYELAMLEQPLWSDDFYFHSMLQKQIETKICLDESIRNRRDALAAIEMDSCRVINIKVGRVGGFTEAIGIHNAAMERGIPVWCGGMLETGIGRSHNIALASLPNFSLPGDVSASSRYWKDDIVEPEITVSAHGEITVPTAAGRGYAVREDLVERLCVRREDVRAFVLA
ncbi:o-succinylbenzoate synthase [Acidipila sp. EB88]|uniref:o-succinylbenzoate synthase n=1 Tax=Acidipila sp. EB88 TaxID=2305226 RepID=UPI000F5E6B46|nr:o-succinylbenzoate synthase [Acidipila sp. EB88]RRA50227.1 o-succinylbenzoate synthase [Acidipila sp. EB88]